MSKKIAFAPKPTPVNPQPEQMDQWVEKRQMEPAPEEVIKRLTIDVSAALHRRIKMQCAARGGRMADEIRAILEQAFPER
jgi:hypothetical protein